MVCRKFKAACSAVLNRSLSIKVLRENCLLVSSEGLEPIRKNEILKKRLDKDCAYIGMSCSSPEFRRRHVDLGVKENNPFVSR